MSALLPCPFCGGPAAPIMGFVGCEPCALVRRDAASWNRRVPDAAAVPAEREAMRLVLLMAPSFQGGHSKTGAEVAAVTAAATEGA